MGQPVDDHLSVVVDVDHNAALVLTRERLGRCHVQACGGQVEPYLSEKELGGDRGKPLGQAQEGGRFLLLALVVVGGLPVCCPFSFVLRVRERVSPSKVVVTVGVH
ncbi:hypothetical protein [Streptomyces brasiliensis]|uniref:hypothetical protein n=1 Tax=Streptomyces brasiliensis TaxID=1954 RepID=UPI00167138AB|nr:hypothetical protein [Streptomyces brasiliensis]